MSRRNYKLNGLKPSYSSGSTSSETALDPENLFTRTYPGTSKILSVCLSSPILIPIRSKPICSITNFCKCKTPRTQRRYYPQQESKVRSDPTEDVCFADFASRSALFANGEAGCVLASSSNTEGKHKGRQCFNWTTNDPLHKFDFRIRWSIIYYPRLGSSDG